MFVECPNFAGCGDLFSWLAVFLHYNARQIILFWIRVIQKLIPREQW